MGKKSNQARFPVARIKKLIQADEDVGKVAQGTPIVVSKALELFLSELVGACVADAQSRGATKISAHTLKRTVNTVPTFDFCADLVADVVDPIGDDDEGAGRKKRTSRKKKVKGEDWDGDDEDGDEEAEMDEEEEDKPAVKAEDDYDDEEEEEEDE